MVVWLDGWVREERERALTDRHSESLHQAAPFKVCSITSPSTQTEQLRKSEQPRSTFSSPPCTSLSIGQFTANFNMPDHATWSVCKLYFSFRIHSAAVEFVQHLMKSSVYSVCDMASLRSLLVQLYYKGERGLSACNLPLLSLLISLLLSIHEDRGRLTEARRSSAISPTIQQLGRGRQEETGCSFTQGELTTKTKVVHSWCVEQHLLSIMMLSSFINSCTTETVLDWLCSLYDI